MSVKTKGQQETAALFLFLVDIMTTSTVLRLLTTILVLVGSHTLYAQRVTLPLRITHTNPLSTREFAFTLGFDRIATYGVDTVLKERDIPTLPLPGSVFYVYTIIDTGEVLWMSPLDLRRLRTTSVYVDTFDMRVQWNGGDGDTLRFALQLVDLPRGIDSVWIHDRSSTWPNTNFRQKLTGNQNVIVTNPALEQFTVRVWVNGVLLSTPDDAPLPLSIRPHPIIDQLRITDLPPESRTVTIADISGRILGVFSADDVTAGVDVSGLPEGPLNVSVVDANGKYRRFVVLRQIRP